MVPPLSSLFLSAFVYSSIPDSIYVSQSSTAVFLSLSFSLSTCIPQYLPLSLSLTVPPNSVSRTLSLSSCNPPSLPLSMFLSKSPTSLYLYCFVLVYSSIPAFIPFPLIASVSPSPWANSSYLMQSLCCGDSSAPKHISCVFVCSCVTRSGTLIALLSRYPRRPITLPIVADHVHIQIASWFYDSKTIGTSGLIIRRTIEWYRS